MCKNKIKDLKMKCCDSDMCNVELDPLSMTVKSVSSKRVIGSIVGFVLFVMCIVNIE
jgi:hypothetical protein